MFSLLSRDTLIAVLDFRINVEAEKKLVSTSAFKIPDDYIVRTASWY